MTKIMKACFIILFLFTILINVNAQPKWVSYTKINSGIPFEKIAYLDFDKSGNIWFGTNVTGSSGHLCRFDGNSFYSESFSAWIYGIKTDKDGNVWIINSNDELKKWDGSKWTSYSNSDLSWYSEPLYIDSKGTKWMNPGFTADILSFDGTNWKKYSNSVLSPVNAIIEYKDNMYFGTTTGLVIYDGQNWTKLDHLNSGLPADKIFDIEIDEHDSMWILCEGGNLIAFKDTTWNIYQSSSISKAPLTLELNSDKIWIHLYNSLVRFDKKTFEVFNSSNTILPNDSYLALEINDKGELWLGTRYGLFKYVEKPDSNISINENKQGSFEQAKIQMFYVASRSELNINTKTTSEMILQIFSVSGKLVLSRKLNSFASQHQIIDLSQLPKGPYIAEISNFIDVLNYKFIIK